jgi:hypothetical protein
VIQPLIAVDQFINTLIYIEGDGWGWSDETLCARLFRCYLQGLISSKWYLAIDFLFFWDTAHCYESWRSEIERNQLPNHYRFHYSLGE